MPVDQGRRHRLVFANEYAWQTVVIKAHGHEPRWTGPGKLTPASRAILKTIDLRFHDLRHEGASRLLERGWPLHHVQHMLGHSSIEQTSTYLNVQAYGLEDSMRRFDSLPLQSKPIFQVLTRTLRALHMRLTCR